MTPNTVEILRYYVCFKDIEEPVLDAFQSKDRNLRKQALKYYMNNHMKIGRNFRVSEQPNFKEEKLLDALDEYNQKENTTVSGLSDFLYEKKLLNERLKRAMVAASKLLWLYNREVIIMDNINREYFGLKEASYEQFVDRWNEYYGSIQPKIFSAIDKNLKQIDPIMSESWFQKRVFDQMVWERQTGVRKKLQPPSKR